MSQENGQTESHDSTEPLKEQTSACGPGCSCHTTGSSKRLRWVLGAIILVAAAVLAGRAVMKSNGASAQASAAAFVTPQRAGRTPALESGPASTPLNDAPAAAEAQAPTAVPSSPVQKDAPLTATRPPEATPPPAVKASASTVAKPPEVAPMVCCGQPILALGDLNRVAMDRDGVFVFLAGKDAGQARATATLIEKAAATIRGKGINMGLFTLSDDSPEYGNLAAQVPPPGVIALVKGKGANAVTGDITESKLVQAFVAASSGGGCGSGGASCGPASAGCR